MFRFKFKPNQKYKIEEIRVLLDWTHGQIVSLLKSHIEKATRSKPVKILGRVLNKWLAENPEPKPETQKSMAYLRDCPRLEPEFQAEQLPAEVEAEAIERIKEIGAMLIAVRTTEFASIRAK